MALFIIGTGLGGAKDLSVRALETMKHCAKRYLESYTSKTSRLIEDLAEQGLLVEPVERSFVEEQAESALIDASKTQDIALLVIGHPLAATTHIDLVVAAKQAGVACHIVHNTSILDALSVTGLQLYKFGKTTSIPFTITEYETNTPAEVFVKNKSIGAHTLFLLDLEPANNKYLSIKDAIEYLLSNPLSQKVFRDDTLCIGCARIGSASERIIYGRAHDLVDADFGEAPYCLIVPGGLHFMEEEALETLAEKA